MTKKEKHLIEAAKEENFNIEIKSNPNTDFLFHPGVKEFSDLVISVVDSLNIIDRVTIQSFDFRILKYIRKEHPHIPLSVLVSEIVNTAIFIGLNSI